MHLPSFPSCTCRGSEVGPGVRRCHAPQLIGTKVVTAEMCQDCFCRQPRPVAGPGAYEPGRYSPRPDDPVTGVVIGSYNWPRLIELQIRLIRHTCGPVPLLVSDDCSPGFGPPPERGGRFEQLEQVCGRYPDVVLWPNVERIGHTGGDVATCWKGLIWARARRLRLLAKLSQRFLITQARWLQEAGRDLLASELPLATQRCRGVEVFDLRTEALLFDVTAWSTPEILHRLLPRRQGRARLAETILEEALRELGGIFWPWKIYTEERYEPTVGVVWHTANLPEDYRELAARFGLDLDDDFTTDGWQQHPDYSYG
jgi:hypothetical protein